MAQDNARGLNSRIAVGGDISGTLDNAEVIALQGIPANVSSPTPGNTITYSSGSSAWIPNSPAVNNVNVSVITNASPSSYTIAANDDAIVITVTTLTPTITILFPASATQGRTVIISNINTSSNTIDIQPHAGTTIDGTSSSIGITNGGIWTCYDGTNWLSTYNNF